MKCKTASSEEDLLDLFAFHVAKEQVQIVVASRLNSQAVAEPGEPVAPNAGAYGFSLGPRGLLRKLAPVLLRWSRHLQRVHVLLAVLRVLAKPKRLKWSRPPFVWR